MAWTVPADFTTGRLVTASDWNAELGTTGNMAQTMPAVVTTAGDLAYATGANAIARLAIGSAGYLLASTGSAPAWSSAMASSALLKVSDSGTNAVVNVATLGHNSSGTPAANYGTGLLFQGKSSSTADRDMATVGTFWTVATDASRTAGLRGQITVSGTLQDAFRIDSTQTYFYNPDPALAAAFSFQTSAAVSNANNVYFRASRGTVGTPSDSQNGDQMGNLIGAAYSSGWFDTSRINYVVDGTFTTGQRPPSRIEFYTNVANGSQTERMRLTSGGQLLVGTSTSNAKMTTGLTVQQGAADDEILALKSSDVAHGMTTHTETDTYGLFQKWSGTDGGCYQQGFSEATIAFALIGRGTTMDTTKSTSGVAPFLMQAAKKSGTSSGALGSTDNLAVIGDAVNGARFIFQADGSAYEDVGTSFTNYDDHDDIALLDSLSVHASRPGDPIHEQFRGWVDSVGREKLQALDLIHFNDDQHHFLNRSKVQMLLIGAVRQLGARLAATTAELTALKQHPALAGA